MKRNIHAELKDRCQKKTGVLRSQAYDNYLSMHISWKEIKTAASEIVAEVPQILCH